MEIVGKGEVLDAKTQMEIATSGDDARSLTTAQRKV
jgi:hypothetical protein